MRIKILLKPEAKIPSKATRDSAGYDLFAAEEVTIERGGVAKVSCGFSMELPAGYEAQIRSRSGLSLKGLTVFNSPGTIDSDYRGEVLALMRYQPPKYIDGVAQMTPDVITIKRGQAIAQMVFGLVWPFHLDVVDVLSDTERGAGGFGSTDKEPI